MTPRPYVGESDVPRNYKLHGGSGDGSVNTDGKVVSTKPAPRGRGW